jgi:hypothetical protein
MHVLGYVLLFVFSGEIIPEGLSVNVASEETVQPTL